LHVVSALRGDQIREGEPPAEPRLYRKPRLGRSLALPVGSLGGRSPRGDLLWRGSAGGSV